ncbi:MAG: DUF2723 domain-containing protein [Muribaculaceae bacterium]|nr:DUF2723 domain-containing protein [Muribaculaceae bacterium]
MKRYKLVNNVLGWLCFVIAAITYLLTMEPTASFWDCPEFILQGAKLEVGHPPGNPIFMLAARFFITLFGGSMSNAALAVNSMSALLSAGTILLLFWSITHLIRRLIVRDDAQDVSLWQMALIMGGGLCGALAYAWSDTFWFSAVEGEVYAFSSFCTALVVWLMFKWENRADNPDSDRYLLLIAYIIGVSIAVHLLNLLCIPALGLIFYYRKYKNVNAIGSLVALAISCAIVAAILFGIVPGFVQVAQWFELFFVNTCGLHYNMGVLIYAILLVVVFIFAIRGLYRNADSIGTRTLAILSIVLSGMPFIGHSILVGVVLIAAMCIYVYVFCKKVPVRVFSAIVICVFVIFVGYSSYALLLIRASANTPMNQNAPDNVFALASYLNREQYGETPLFRGPVFAETFEEQEYPENSGNYYILVDEYGRPRVRTVDGYLRDENGGALNAPACLYTKVVKNSPDEPDRYVKEIERPNYRTMPDLDMYFTRMYSNEPTGAHVEGYKSWAGYTTPDINSIPQNVRSTWAQQGFAPKYELMPYLQHLQPATSYIDSRSGASLLQTLVWKPDFGVNLRFFVNYQLNHMYWRYFMWNFAGRQNDIQGNGEPHLGNWISGIPALDNARLGDQSSLPDEFGKGNKGHNVFYMLPLLLGLIGLLYQALYNHRNNPMRGIQQFWVVFFLFFMTGIAIVLYLNQPPGQVRERDYAYAGSFYAFAIWIGLAVPAIGVMLRDLLSKKDKDGNVPTTKGAEIATAVVACVIGLAVPLQMVSQTWDDHDRSGRYTTRDFGFDYLSSLDPNAIIFTNGDNDTFPLWYAQEVEEFRTDVRVVNLSYLTTDWYADQMLHPTSGADAIDMYVTPRDYAYERLAYSLIYPRERSLTDARTALLNLYASDDKRFGAPYIDTPNVFIPVDADAAMARYSSGDAEIDSMYLAPYLDDIHTDFSRLGSTGLNQSRVLSFDMIANSITRNWTRPVYFASTVPSSYYLGMTPYLSATGLAYEVTPFYDAEYNPTAQKAYRNIVANYRWGGLDKENAEKLYLDETVRRMVSSVRSGAYTVIENLLQTPEAAATEETRKVAVENGLEEPETHIDMARQLLDIIVSKLPSKVSQYDGMMGLYFARTYLDLYLMTGKPSDLDAALSIAVAEADRYAQLVKYATTLDPITLSQLGRSETYALQYLGEAMAIINKIDILTAKPDIFIDPDMDANIKLLRGMTLETDLRIAPLIYIMGYSYDELSGEIESLSEGQQKVIRSAMDILALNKAAGTDPMKFSRDIMDRYGFTSEQWNFVAN